MYTKQPNHNPDATTVSALTSLLNPSPKDTAYAEEVAQLKMEAARADRDIALAQAREAKAKAEYAELLTEHLRLVVEQAKSAGNIAEVKIPWGKSS